ncbi:MAG: hypothetical protein V1758_09080 [Pseudomonadota bacterium]
MSYYIVCQRKRNNPRVDVCICEKKCPLKDDCKEYIAYHKIVLQDKPLDLGPGLTSLDLKAA